MINRQFKMFVLVISILVLGTTACAEQVSQSVKDGKIINFYCYKLNETDKTVLNIAAKKLNELHPEYTVIVTEFMEKNFSTDKYVTTVNTKLMSGEGCDLITLDYLPVQKYYEKNIFANLDELVLSEQFDKDLYFWNVFDACRIKGSLYALPIHFNIRAVIGSREILQEEGIEIDDDIWSIRDLFEYSKQVTKDIDGNGTIDRYAFPKFDIGLAVSVFLETDKYVDYEKKEAYFSSDEFIDLIHTLKDFSDSNLMHKQIIMGTTREYKDQKATVFAVNEIYGFRGLLATKYQLGGGDRLFFKFPVSKAGSNTPGISRFMLAINNKSPNKQLAAEFLKLMLSKEIQQLYGLALDVQGFPVLKEAFDSQLENVKKLDWRLQSSAGWIPVILDKQDINFIYDYANSIDTMTYVDEKILAIVTAEVNKLLGSKSLRDNNVNNAVRDIQNKVNLYLEE